jgi:glycosyltransferase involved in cell wall biosynthesis
MQNFLNDLFSKFFGMTLFLSIIIPTRNRSDLLSRALNSIIEQTFDQRDFEIIVVDNGSKDMTRSVSWNFSKCFKNFKYFYEVNPGLHSGRHVGLKRSQGEIVVFADDDIKAFPTWLEGIAEAFQNNDVILAGGKILPLFESEPPLWLVKLWEKSRDEGRILGYLSLLDLGNSTKDISPYHVFGCNYSIRKPALVEAGGFHPDAMPPELVRYRGDGETYVSKFIFENGYRALYHPKASVYHWVPEERMTEVYFCKRAYLQGISDSYSKIRYDGEKFHWGTVIRILIKHLPKNFWVKLEAKILFSYLKGYIYHFKEVHKNPGLREWVIQKDYLE